MAVIWSKTIDGKKYEVRAAGKTRRLYTDGVFHSQHHPDRYFAGSIWDLLWLPALFYPPARLRRILLLGVGGGAVIHMLRHYAEPEVIDAIDINPVHLQIARRFFGVKPSLANLIRADGIHWLQNYNGPRYDMIIDDMYGEENGVPVRATGLDYPWLATMRKHLNPNGVLVLNTLSSRQLKKAACFTHPRLTSVFKAAYQFSDPAYHNAIGAVFITETDAKIFRKRLKQYPALNRLDFRFRRIN